MINLCSDYSYSTLLVSFQIAQLDEVKIRISALRAIIDLLLMFGFQLLSDTAAPWTALPSQSPDRQEEDTPSADKKLVAQEDSAQSILVMLSQFLDSEVCPGLQYYLNIFLNHDFNCAGTFFTGG